MKLSEARKIAETPVVCREILIVDRKLSVRVGESVYPVKDPDACGVLWAEKWEGKIISGEFFPIKFVRSLT